MANSEYTLATCAAATFDGLRIIRAEDFRRTITTSRPDKAILNVSGSPADLLRHGLVDASMLAGMGDARLKSFGGPRKGTDTYTEIAPNQNGTLRVLIFAYGPARLALHARLGYSVERADLAEAMAEMRARSRSALELSEWATLQ